MTATHDAATRPESPPSVAGGRQQSGDRRRAGLGRWVWPERFRPWQGVATRTDLALTGAFLAVMTLGFAIRPVKPFLLASHPVALELISGDLLSIGAAAAFARIGEVSLWLVLVAGAIGMAKFDWLVWWAGRQWGAGMIRMVAAPEQATRWADRAAGLKPWVLRVAVVAAVLPGIPAPIVYAVAGIAGMRLLTFVALNLAGTLAITGLVAGLGYQLGQDAVDLVLLIDRYASLVSLTLIGAAFLLPWLRSRMRRRAERAASPAVVEVRGAPATSLETTPATSRPSRRATRSTGQQLP
ncbi:MAG TPA: VTT domain-containing protein [Nocardioides sp.]|nr:VTT domain-containing protein [Nocardioides sp.]